MDRCDRAFPQQEVGLMGNFVGNTLSPIDADPSDVDPSSADETSGSIWRDSLINIKAVTDIYCVHLANPHFSYQLASTVC